MSILYIDCELSILKLSAYVFPQGLDEEGLNVLMAMIDAASFPEQLRIFCNTELFLRNPKVT